MTDVNYTKNIYLAYHLFIIKKKTFLIFILIIKIINNKQ